MDIKLHENGLYLDIDVSDEGEVCLLNLSAQPRPRPENRRWYRLVELQMAGCNQNDNHGSKHTGTQPGSLLKYQGHTFDENHFGTRLALRQQWRDLRVVSCMQFYTGIPAVRSWTEVTNTGDTPSDAIEYVSSFALTGLSAGERRDTSGHVHIPHSTWFGEAQWKKYTLRELGYDAVMDFSMKRIHLSSTGSWPCGEHLPMGVFENTQTGQATAWQIETTGSWSWELSDIDSALYLQISGPGLQENGFSKRLQAGETFVSVPCAAAFADGGFEEGIRQLTRYRRAIRRPNEDNAHPSVIFNDYMNCLMGDPTTEKELPMIDAAAGAGCKYYCIDCGWYSDGDWWDGVGEWLPSSARFPDGLLEPLDYIRKKDMIPGLWLEIEVMGVACPLAQKVPKDWFFQRGGRPIVDRGRYLLDFRHPGVIAHANAVVDRLVNGYGVGYIKNDYNVNAGPGTELNADSAGDGLLAHTRAYLRWLDSVFERYPDIVIENCGSGGMRMEYSLLSRCSIQSVTDQTDYMKMAAIACNCMTAVTPEQAAIWSYPLVGGDEEETIFNMVNAILFRIHQSGHIAKLSPERIRYIHEGIRYHLSICERVKDGLPFWPLGLASMSASHFCAGIDCGDVQYLAVWNVRSREQIRIPVRPDVDAIRCAYPAALNAPMKHQKDTHTLTIDMAPKTARIFELYISV